MGVALATTTWANLRIHVWAPQETNHKPKEKGGKTPLLGTTF